ncbi:MAG: hypothetical protein R3181_06000 [Rubricoccaceae bacterium]|nr:hypothetical protein [Rubricoccaceae bacterium]
MRVSLALLLLGPLAAVAQPRHLETLEGALSGVAPAGEAYDGLWTMGPGGALRVGTEFFGGRAHFALHAFPNEPTTADPAELPEFLALRGTVGWGPRLGLPLGLGLTAGGTVGAVHMRFDDEDLAGNALVNETELAAGLFARLDVPVAGPVHLFAEAEVAHVYTAVPIRYRFVQGGVSVSLPAPPWLRRLLR